MCKCCHPHMHTLFDFIIPPSSLMFTHWYRTLHKVHCDMNTCGGGWTLVWKHSYLEVGALTPDMYYFSTSYQPCTNINSGWCNIPYKSGFGATEMMIVAYHKKTVVYAYKGDFNENLDVDWTGGKLENSQQCVDLCATVNNGIRPAPSSVDDDPKLLGIAFDKHSPDDEFKNCDTVHGTFDNPEECRWHDCYLPSGISTQSSQTQMTMAYTLISRRLDWISDNSVYISYTELV